MAFFFWLWESLLTQVFLAFPPFLDRSTALALLPPYIILNAFSHLYETVWGSIRPTVCPCVTHEWDFSKMRFVDWILTNGHQQLEIMLFEGQVHEQIARTHLMSVISAFALVSSLLVVSVDPKAIRFFDWNRYRIQNQFWRTQFNRNEIRGRTMMRMMMNDWDDDYDGYEQLKNGK